MKFKLNDTVEILINLHSVPHGSIGVVTDIETTRPFIQVTTNIKGINHVKYLYSYELRLITSPMLEQKSKGELREIRAKLVEAINLIDDLFLPKDERN